MSNCPVCYDSAAKATFSLTAVEAAQHFVQLEGNPKRNRELALHISTLWGSEECSILQCNACGFRFADPFAAGDAVFYNLAYERSGYPSDKWEFERTVRDLKRSNFSAERVLEAGAGFGFFLDKIVEAYVTRSGITALEFSDSAVRTLRSKGYFTLQQDIRSGSFEKPFDAIFLYQVVEHMNNLDGLFARFAQLLRNNGLLFIAVPNARLTAFNEKYGGLLDMPPNHIGGWSAEAFQIIGSRHGLKLEWHEVEPFSLGTFAKQDIIYSYLRRSQQVGTMENKSRALRSKRYGKMLGAFVAALGAPRRVNVWRRAARLPNMGGSLLVKFTKI